MKILTAMLYASAAFMSEIIPTMQIETDNGPVTINVSDFDAAKHTPVGGAAPAPVDAPQPDGARVNPNSPEGSNAPQLANQDHANGGQAPTPPAAAPAASAGDNTSLLVTKKGKNFIVVDAAGNAVQRDGIEPEGYKSESDAWAAVMALAKPKTA